MAGPVFDFAGQVAVVTGAASGIGEAAARRFAESGAAVVLADVDEDALDRLAGELSSDGAAALPVRCDVADQRDAERMIDDAVRRFGRVDHAFNAAGIQVPETDVADQTADEFDRVVAVNLRGM